MGILDGDTVSALELSNDHKPYQEKEKERIVKAGGEIGTKDKYILRI